MGAVWRRRQFNGDSLQPYVNSTDLFEKLPIELKQIILCELGSKDIANLRLVSRAFRQLPQQLFRDLLVKELPWFWEIDQIQQRKMEIFRKMLLERHGEDLAGLNERNDSEYVQFFKDCIAMKSPSFVWKRVYDQVKRLQKGNLGVRNRVRVWGLAERIVERIGHLRGMESAGERYDLKGDEDNLQVEPTQDEVDSGAVNHGNCIHLTGGIQAKLLQALEEPSRISPQIKNLAFFFWDIDQKFDPLLGRQPANAMLGQWKTELGTGVRLPLSARLNRTVIDMMVTKREQFEQSYKTRDRYT
ncbi:hypothetical protein BofuT4_P113510.1 [Botrytis cinerea T4]|uniref:F-box domain-containing protein n=1 Tax=Botryotinia fuckeliana (strain T4) TaxID=999810 RepID=G2Y5A7_BOTF4|nr:hypothetical protein BofuT4_P113510.1 [Botrytis cinerea T4]